MHLGFKILDTSYTTFIYYLSGFHPLNLSQSGCMLVTLFIYLTFINEIT